MQAFTFSAARDERAALAAVAGSHAARFLAGGTTLVDLMKLEVERPAHVVDINALPLDKVEEIGGGLRLGALVRNSDLAQQAAVRERYPMLAQALLAGA